MRIAGLQKLTLLDFPDKTAATVFTAGCNLRCPFCHNAELVYTSAQEPNETLSEEDFFAFLKSRRGLLDGVCITGGEPLLQPGLDTFCNKIKEEGFAVKLDTNGFFPDRLQALISAQLIDYVALDVKNHSEKYAETVGVASLNLTPLHTTLDLLREDSVAYEFRTTVVKEYHTSDDLFALATLIKKARAWYLQGFVDSAEVLAGHSILHPWEKEDLRAIVDPLRALIPNTFLRGQD